METTEMYLSMGKTLVVIVSLFVIFLVWFGFYIWKDKGELKDASSFNHAKYGN